MLPSAVSLLGSDVKALCRSRTIKEDASLTVVDGSDAIAAYGEQEKEVEEDSFHCYW